MQKDRKKNSSANFVMMNVFAGHFMGLHLAAPAKKFFFKRKNGLLIRDGVLKWAKKTAIFLKILTGILFPYYKDY